PLRSSSLTVGRTIPPSFSPTRPARSRRLEAPHLAIYALATAVLRPDCAHDEPSPGPSAAGQGDTKPRKYRGSPLLHATPALHVRPGPDGYLGCTRGTAPGTVSGGRAVPADARRRAARLIP